MERPHPPIPDIIAQAVSTELQRRGCTVTLAADLAGIHRTALTRWLCGRRSVRACTAAKVLEALDLQIGPPPEADTARRNGAHHKPPG